jgi:molybdenum cofactor guanylyltransferase
MNEQKSLNGLILNGGKSSRMGFEKGLIAFHGKPQKEFLIDLLGGFCDQVFISGKGNGDESFPFLPDKFDLESPLNGILTALEHEDANAWLTVPVDMPGITAEVIAFLIANRDTTQFATCFYDANGKSPEPLVAIWEPQSALLLREFYRAGKKSPREFLMTNRVRLLPSPRKDFHSNINTPAELRNFRDNLFPGV